MRLIMSRAWLNENNDEILEKDLSHRLKKALNSGDIVAFKRLVKGGVDVNAKYWYDSTLLHEAVTVGNPQLIEVLLQNKAKVNAENKDGRTALHIATRAGKPDIIHQLLKAGAEINKQTADGQTALHIAIWRGKYDIVDTLLEAGSQINIEDKDGWSPLHWATKRSNGRVVKQLVERGAVIDCKITKSGQTPFCQAIENGNLDLAKYLLLHGADVKVSIKGKSAPVILMKDKHLSEQQIIDMIDILIQNGYIIQNDNLLNSGRLGGSIGTIHERLKQSFQNRFRTVQSLNTICRSSIRSHISRCTSGRSIVEQLKLLPLPSILVDYLIFRESLHEIQPKFDFG